MLIALITIAIALSIAVALWWTSRGEAPVVVGEGNNFESYYGKKRTDPNPQKSPPCEACASRGCIGAGECRCRCHHGEAAVK